MSRVSSADPSDDLTTDELIKIRIEAERKQRKAPTAYAKTKTTRQLAIIDSRLGAPPSIKPAQLTNQNNLTPYEYNHYVRERYAPLYPIRGRHHLRSYNTTNSLGRTATESSNRAKRGNGKIVRRRRRKRKKKSKV